MERVNAVSYTPKILKSMREICGEMGVGAKVVRRWAACGAPIAVEGSKRNARYSAEAVRLQLWRESFGKGQAGDFPRPLSSSARQGRPHGVRRFFDDTQVRADGRVGLTFALLPIPQRAYRKAELLGKHGLGKPHTPPNGSDVHVFDANRMRAIGGRISLALGDFQGGFQALDNFLSNFAHGYTP